MSDRIYISQDDSRKLYLMLRSVIDDVTHPAGDGGLDIGIVDKAERLLADIESSLPSCSDCGADMVTNPEHPETFICLNCGAKSGQS